MKLKQVLNQWSTVRGMVLMAATAVGVNTDVISAGAELIDAMPVLITAAIGFYDVVRDDKKEAAS